MTADEPTLRLTYAELAARRGITVAAARRLTLRHRWHKQVGNDGKTRVDVPVSAVPAGAPAVAADDAATAADRAADTVRALTDAVATLREQLARERGRADRAEAALDAMTAEHKATVAALLARIPTRRRWWHWRR